MLPITICYLQTTKELSKLQNIFAMRHIYQGFKSGCTRFCSWWLPWKRMNLHATTACLTVWSRFTEQWIVRCDLCPHRSRSLARSQHDVASVQYLGHVLLQSLSKKVH